MDWRKLLLSPHGRIGRKSFWIWYGVSFGAALIAALIDAAIFGFESERTPISGLISIATIYPTFCVNVKRLHDTGRSGWWLLAPAAAIVFVAIASVIFVSPGGAPASNAGLIAIVVLAIVAAVLSIMLVAWTGVFRGAPDANKYGEPNSGDRKVAPVAEVFS